MTVVPTDIVNSVTIKLEPGLDQIIDTEAYYENNNQESQAIIKEEFSYYSSSGPKYEKFSKHLTVREMVRLHFDPYTSSFDLSKQPILVLEKVDKFWPVVKSVSDIKTEIKEEPIEDILDDALDDSEWDKAAEEEILAANEGYLDTSDSVSVPSPQTTFKSSSSRPRRKKSKPKSYKEDFDSDKDPDDVDHVGDDTESMLDEENNGDDPDFDDTKSDDSYMMDMFDSDDSNVEDDANIDLSLVKEEIDNIDEEEGSTRAGRLLASSNECKIVEIGGMKVETYGDYSKCPKCFKNIKSTFIIRHIKLHDLQSVSMNCPYEDCTTSFTRSNNMYG